VNPNKKNIEIIKQFNLSPHPEGGWFREIVRSENSLIREDGQSRNFITGIYYLLERDAKSAWHRVKNADEIWIYLRGDPPNLLCLDNDNKLIRNSEDRPLNKSKFHQHFLLCAKHFLHLSPKDNKFL